MPRIDPLQLLKCLSVLLSPEGGIFSRDEVPRLVNLMTKFSKKLVSKCVYVLILKNTETSLVDMFMAEGGWTLIQTWLQDAAQSGNWDLVKEILGLLLITPVDVERLKMNCLPKLIKNLSRREDLDGVASLSNQIVQNWLVIVKGSAHTTVNTNNSTSQPTEKSDVDITTANNDLESSSSLPKESASDEPAENLVSSNNVVADQSIKPSTFYKVSVKDGKQVIRKLSLDSDSSDKQSKTDEVKADEDKDKEKSRNSSSSKSRSSSSSSRDKDREKDKRRGSSSSSSSSNSSSSSKDKKDSKDRKSKEETKEKQAEKDKDTLEKVKPASLDKVGRIPKKSGSDEKQKENKSDNKSKDDKDVKKKPTFSILNKKATGEERTKTVKVFNSKMRSTGLEEEVKPPPPRGSKKPSPSVQLPTIPPKRPSPPREHIGVPPEKKLKVDKVDLPERPGSIKLIPPKPKPAVLQESDMFMDALNASAPKKETKKRKRRPSITKEVPASPSSVSNGTESQTPTSPTTPVSPTSSLGLKNIAPINFYQDTLSASTDNVEDKEDSKDTADENDQDANDAPASPTTPTEETDVRDGEVALPAKVARTDGIKGVLLYTKKKGPKRSIKWKSDDDLVEVRYFELDETERVNVTKTFMDMAKMELSSEREALIMSRKLSNEDVMEPQMMWRMPFLCEQPESLVIPGSKSLEKDIQFAREKTVLPALYFDKRRIPDSPEEPIPENHQMSDPVIIPLDDPDSQEIDLRSTPWPEPKGFAPQAEPQQIPTMFPNIPFNPNFNQMGNIGPPVGQFPGVPPPRFPGPGGPGHGPMGPAPGPGNFGPPNLMHNNMGPPINQSDMMNQGPINSGIFGPGPDGFMAQGAEPNFHMQPPFNGPQGPNMNMFGPNNFNNHRGRGGFRRGGNNGGWVRMSGPMHNWKRGGGGGNRGGRLCKNIQNHGYCRNGDNCPFVHPT
ncbi:hypothetical protein GWI33_020316 [Rhynchophorus ferrugineus]|uniref:Serine/threonine-protein phosphatase 1 regulatory subunit 10 n=1 Tax=Rhynchophorus ferrugineus TaxID=354439 RepID=A0A834HSJ4_RHYFE|nr:hypothetical protein GWI33_020316 [Rhynchophorus ferrugineus]